MKQSDRYYKFWSKKIARCEKKAKLLDHCYVKQIERSFDSGMITQEQFDEFQERITALRMRVFRGY